MKVDYPDLNALELDTRAQIWARELGKIVA